ncbi:MULTISPECIES: ABC transporter permease [Ruminococcus]|nr:MULTISPECIES: ABC-2 family transporter protein [Ruminococcus]
MLIGLSYRVYFFVSILTNIISIVLYYYMWLAVYDFDKKKVINGSTFSETFSYVVIAMGIYSFLQVWLEWRIQPDVISGNISVKLIKPIDYQFSLLSEALGASINNFIAITIPTLVLVLIISPSGIVLGRNIFFFVISMIFSYFLNFCIDFIIGLTAFYTESIWGISTTKEAIVLFLSGAVIPLYFFPEKIRTVIEMLPFRYIYNVPIQMLQNSYGSTSQMFTAVFMQLFWTIVLICISRIMYLCIVKKLMVNGG